MKLAAASARILHGFEQDRMFEEVAVLDHQLDASRVHVHDAARSNVQVANFAVAHLPIRQANVRAAGLNQRIRIFTQQAVVSRLACQCDGVSFGFGAIAPAVEDDEDEWFGTGQAASS